MYQAVAAYYSRAMQRAARLPRGVMDLEALDFALCTALSATLDKMAERKVIDDKLARTARLVPVTAVVPNVHPIMAEAMRGFGAVFGAPR
ncbi:MAG TPA: hypothetical protein DCM32_05090 [Xanthomonadaceae bacterium]|nr:hypothetical protein [Xanthomonadaceae bacterium]